MSYMIRLRAIAAACAATLLIVGCSSSTAPGTSNKQTPPLEVVTASIVAPTSGSTLSQTATGYPNALVSITASASSPNRGGDTFSFAWTADGAEISATTDSLSMLFPLGSHTLCVVAISTSSGIKSSQVCTTFTVVPASMNLHVWVADLDGGAHTFQHEYAVIVDSTFLVATDSILVGSDGSANFKNPKFAIMDTVPIILRGDPNLKWFAADVPKTYDANFNPILVPNEVTIPTGTYTGQVIPIHLDSAYQLIPNDTHLSFYGRDQLPDDSYVYAVGDWKTLPVPVALSGVTTALDSSHFEVALASMETVFGLKLFTLTDSVTLSRGCGTLINYSPTNLGSGGTWQETPDFCNGYVNIVVPDSHMVHFWDDVRIGGDHTHPGWRANMCLGEHNAT